MVTFVFAHSISHQLLACAPQLAQQVAAIDFEIEKTLSALEGLPSLNNTLPSKRLDYVNDLDKIASGILLLPEARRREIILRLSKLVNEAPFEASASAMAVIYSIRKMAEGPQPPQDVAAADEVLWDIHEGLGQGPLGPKPPRTPLKSLLIDVQTELKNLSRSNSRNLLEAGKMPNLTGRFRAEFFQSPLDDQLYAIRELRRLVDDGSNAESLFAMLELRELLQLSLGAQRFGSHNLRDLSPEHRLMIIEGSSLETLLIQEAHMPIPKPEDRFGLSVSVIDSPYWPSFSKLLKRRP